MNEMYTQLMLAIIATIASFVGLVISKEQKTSEFRQVWIDTLRDEISKFLGQVDKTEKLVLINKMTKKGQREETSSAVIIDSVTLIELKFKIELLINPKESEHIQLVEILNNTIQNIREGDCNSSNLESITCISQEILKKEWNRVKDGESYFKRFRQIFAVMTCISFVVMICVFFLYVAFKFIL